MYPKNFEILIKKIFENEGVYSNDPNDPGGESFLGISRNYHPNWKGWNLVDEFKTKFDVLDISLSFVPLDILEEAKKFYFEYYWKKLYLDRVPENSIFLIFDTGVNMSIKKAIILLQRTINVYPDGIIGPITLGALKQFDKNVFYYKYKIERISEYINLCKKHPKFKKYLLGWINRTLKA